MRQGRACRHQRLRPRTTLFVCLAGVSRRSRAFAALRPCELCSSGMCAGLMTVAGTWLAALMLDPICGRPNRHLRQLPAGVPKSKARGGDIFAQPSNVSSWPTETAKCGCPLTLTVGLDPGHDTLRRYVVLSTKFVVLTTESDVPENAEPSDHSRRISSAAGSQIAAWTT